MVRNWSLVGAAIGAVLFLAVASKAQEPLPGAQEKTAFELTPAVIAMRWQWLNPNINSFTFREGKDVFEYRDVHRAGEVWDLPRGEAITLPGDYEAFAERSFTNAFLVIRDGRIVFEDYLNRMTPETRHIAFSMSKTITGLLIGIALDRGEIGSLDDPAMRYIPQLENTGYDGVTIRQIMQMRSGVDYDERYDFGDNPSFAGKLHGEAIVNNRMRFAEGALQTIRANEPGSTFNYSTLDTMVLGWLLENATGQKLERQLEERIWQPLGAEADGFWLADGPPGGGRALNGMGFNATLRDFGRLGLLMLHDGKRGEERIIPAGWIEQMTAMQPTGRADRQGYGLQVWKTDDEPGSFTAIGLAGQYIYVHPENETVVVKLSYYPPAEPPGLSAETFAYFREIAKRP